jgi:hypothetical protein
MAATKWQTRGWTYQESILPTRKLHLMKNQTWFECSKTIIYESLSPSYYRGERIWHKILGEPAKWVGTLLNGLDSRWDAYQRHLYAYSVLSLGRDADILDAFSGIIQSLYGLGSATFGLPLVDFDRALLWSVYKSPVSENKYRHSIRATSHVQTVNVMLIGTDDEGYNYRLGIGQILLSKWVKAERCFKDIALR